MADLIGYDVDQWKVSKAAVDYLMWKMADSFEDPVPQWVMNMVEQIEFVVDL